MLKDPVQEGHRPLLGVREDEERLGSSTASPALDQVPDHLRGDVEDVGPDLAVAGLDPDGDVTQPECLSDLGQGALRVRLKVDIGSFPHNCGVALSDIF